MKNKMKKFQAALLLSSCAFIGAAFLAQETQAQPQGCGSIGCRIWGDSVCAEILMGGELVTCYERIPPQCI